MNKTLHSMRIVLGLHRVVHRHPRCVRTNSVRFYSSPGQQFVDGTASLFTLIHNGTLVQPPTLSETIPAVTDVPVFEFADALSTVPENPELLPWWAAVVAGTFVFRAVFTLPFAVTQRNRVLRLASLQPVLKAWESTLRRTLNSKDPSETAKAQAAFKQKAEVLYAQNHCSPRATFILPWVQIPLFFSLSLAVRRLAGLPLPFSGSSSSPDFSQGLSEAEGSLSDGLSPEMGVSISERAYALMPVDGFNEGGILWFLDLSVADPTILLPLIVGGLHLANIEMHSSTVANPTVRQRAFKLLFQSISIFMIPLATQVPAGVALYWASSAGFSFMQNFALQSLLKPRPLNK
ncbi:60Kd inner membrane protein-domain-containing protein [Chytriomyces cf. hyalinus JEL632]|nr:60Kd inner membrane protein-domain-containing protein [Chytriomyces cf. hyalinus JEL632]